MSKKKMCEFFSDGADVKSFRDNCKGFIYPCPKNTNAKCEIIPKKTKMVIRKINRKIGGTNTYQSWGKGETRIELSNGYTVFVSNQDVPALQKHIWFLQSGKGGSVYATSRINGVRVVMHRFILKTEKGKEIDHKDGNGLNNTRPNLRPCTSTQNKHNSKKRHGCSSRYKGVSWHKGENKWHAKITVNKKVISLGYFKHEHLAAEAYNWAAMKHFGEFAKTNTILIDEKYLRRGK